MTQTSLEADAALIRQWRHANRMRAAMFAVPALYTMLGLAVERYVGADASLAIAVTGLAAGLHANGKAMDRVEELVRQPEMSTMIAERLLQDLSDRYGDRVPEVEIRRPQEYGDPFYPSRSVVSVGGRLARYDWRRRKFIDRLP